LFPQDTIHQFKLWLAITVSVFPLAIVLFGFLLKFLTKRFWKISLSFERTIWVQFMAMILPWLFTLILLVLTPVIQNQVVIQTLDGVAGFFIAAGVYAKMLKDPESVPIGMQRGLRLSAVMTLIIIFLKISIQLLRA
jgi:vacuolar-type H+-ATPase subunit I/STV1